jgi:hypothetical protein
MASPNFTQTGRLEGVLITAGYAQSQTAGAIGTDSFLLFTPGANGSYVRFVRFMATATAAATNTTATVGRVFVSTVNTGTTTTSNTELIGEINLPVVSAASSTVAQSPLDLYLEMVVPNGSYLLVTNHASPASNTAWYAVVVGGNY